MGATGGHAKILEWDSGASGNSQVPDLVQPRQVAERTNSAWTVGPDPFHPTPAGNSDGISTSDEPNGTTGGSDKVLEWEKAEPETGDNPNPA